MSFNHVDFHCHLDLYPNFAQLVDLCEQSKIFTLAVTTTPRAWPKNHELTKQKCFVKAALGLHPQLVSDKHSELEIWEQYLNEAIFIGEVGLDASSRYYATFEKQKQIFDYILKRCDEVGGRILSIHSVRSTTPVLDMIEKRLSPDQGRAVFHWFTGSLVELQKALKLKCYFSINPQMLTTGKGVDLVKQLPLERMLTETDGPFVKISDSIIQPKDIGNTINKIAQIRNTTPQHIGEAINSNLQDLMLAMRVPLERSFKTNV